MFSKEKEWATYLPARPQLPADAPQQPARLQFLDVESEAKRAAKLLHSLCNCCPDLYLLDRLFIVAQRLHLSPSWSCVTPLNKLDRGPPVHVYRMHSCWTKKRLLVGVAVPAPLLLLLFLSYTASALSMSKATTGATASTVTSLGGQTLRTIVTRAAETNVQTSLDLSGIFWLEHINLVIGSKELASFFYLDVLGLTKDSGGSFHCNLGQQQFHLAETGDPAQRVTGSVGLVFPNLDTVRERVQAAASEQNLLKQTQFRVLDNQPDCLTLSCPWGNQFHCYSVEHDGDTTDVDTTSTSDSTQKMVKLHASGGAYGTQRMAVRGNPGIRYVEIACLPNTVEPIARFYKEMLNCAVHTSTYDGREVAAIRVGPGVHLVFVETKDLPNKVLEAMNGVHICVYIDNFEGLYQKLSERNLIWTNPRFTHLDRCDTWEEAKASRTLRFKDIIDLRNGAKILELEHETRPLIHGQYLKVPNYDPV